MMNIRSPRHNHVGTFDCEVEHPDFGWIPYTADPNDVEPVGREIHARILAGEAGPVADAPPLPLDWNVPPVVQMRQFRLALLAAGKLSAVQSVIDALPAQQRDETQIEWDYATSVPRNAPWVGRVLGGLGISGDAALDLFRVAGEK